LDQRRVETCVEALCHKGCKAVWREIEAFEAGRLPPEAASLTPSEQRAVLSELKAIMAVYDQGSCPV
jgi:hypothetical protein